MAARARLAVLSLLLIAGACAVARADTANIILARGRPAKLEERTGLLARVRAVG